MLVSAPRHPASAAGALLKEACPPQKGGLKSAGTLPKSPPRRNATKGKNGPFLKGITGIRSKNLPLGGMAAKGAARLRQKWL
jgi:hypothetical protein